MAREAQEVARVVDEFVNVRVLAEDGHSALVVADEVVGFIYAVLALQIDPKTTQVNLPWLLDLGGTKVEILSVDEGLVHTCYSIPQLHRKSQT